MQLSSPANWRDAEKEADLLVLLLLLLEFFSTILVPFRSVSVGSRFDCLIAIGEKHRPQATMVLNVYCQQLTVSGIINHIEQRQWRQPAGPQSNNQMTTDVCNIEMILFARARAYISKFHKKSLCAIFFFCVLIISAYFTYILFAHKSQCAYA